MTTATTTAQDLTLSDINVLQNQITDLLTVKTQLVKNRDELEGNLTKINALITALTRAVNTGK